MTSSPQSNILSSTSPPEFLTEFYQTLPELGTSPRPRVTLTFAQSLDAKIAGIGGKQLILSGKESMIMTHWMRTMHDAIMVGIGTALNDNPQLNTRHLPPRDPSHGQPYHLPIPIILDGDVRLPIGCKLINNYKNDAGKCPWVVCRPDLDGDALKRKQTLEDAGVRVIPVPTSSQHPRVIDLRAMLSTLSEQGVKSLMVEGGASVIKSFFGGLAGTEQALVDAIIVTVAPVFVGSQGVGYDVELENSDRLDHYHSTLLGRDAVMLMKVASDKSQ